MPVFCLEVLFLHSYHPHHSEEQRHSFITTQFGPFDDVLTEFHCTNTPTRVCDMKIDPNYRTDLINKDIFRNPGFLHRRKSPMISVTPSQKTVFSNKAIKTDSSV